jgi:hypothetical protein
LIRSVQRKNEYDFRKISKILIMLFKKLFLSLLKQIHGHSSDIYRELLIDLKAKIFELV